MAKIVITIEDVENNTGGTDVNMEFMCESTLPEEDNNIESLDSVAKGMACSMLEYAKNLQYLKDDGTYNPEGEQQDG